MGRGGGQANAQQRRGGPHGPTARGHARVAPQRHRARPHAPAAQPLPGLPHQSTRCPRHTHARGLQRRAEGVPPNAKTPPCALARRGCRAQPAPSARLAPQLRQGHTPAVGQSAATNSNRARGAAQAPQRAPAQQSVANNRRAAPRRHLEHAAPPCGPLTINTRTCSSTGDGPETWPGRRTVAESGLIGMERPDGSDCNDMEPPECTSRTPAVSTGRPRCYLSMARAPMPIGGQCGTSRPGNNRCASTSKIRVSVPMP